jgi:hypothetical protein
LVVGAGLALFSGLLASLLIPALTRVWQDHPKELALKRDLVARISQSSTEAIIRARYFPAEHPTASEARRSNTYTHTASRWQVGSAAIGSELATYFPHTSLPLRWQRYTEAVREYLNSQILYGAASANFNLSTLRDYFRRLRLDRSYYPEDESTRKAFVAGDDFADFGSYEILGLLEAERDLIESAVIDSRASGFSHGFWIFR